FRLWWRDLFGQEENLSNEGMRKLAGNFARRIYAWARSRGVPVLEGRKGERKDELAATHVEQAEREGTLGVFLIVTGLAPAPVWRIDRNGSGTITNIHREKPWPYVKHYHFHIMDADWGHVIVRVGGYPPYGLQVILNGHEWVKCQLAAHSHSFETTGNCFTAGNPRIVHYWCNRLIGEEGAGLLETVCRRWVYGSVLPFALSRQEQERSGFEYDWRIYQLEYSRNYVFHSGRAMEEIHNGLIDRNRSRLDVKEVKTIFGVRGRPHKRLRSANEPRGRRDTAFKAVNELEHNLSVFKLHWANSTLKIYDKGARLLRVEAVEHNVKKTKSRGRLDRWVEIAQGLGERVGRFVDAVELLDHGLLNMGRFEQLRKPSNRGTRRLAGIDMDIPRMRRAVEALISLAPRSEGFTRGDLVAKVKGRPAGRCYKKREASYDLSKLRGKGIVEPIPKTRRYRVVGRKIRELATLHVIREKVLKPLHAKAGAGLKKRIKSHTPMDRHYEKIREDLFSLFEYMNIKTA
ncbi:MAG: hypothetical protein U9P12_09790, partial [Verrucomicrobiota bacterium]|nr:hypothetical protein [Verrucomicrobiota bacterium]